MTTAASSSLLATMPAMGRGEIDRPTRENIVAHLRRIMWERKIPSVRRYAKFLETNHAYLSRVLGGEVTPGLDLLIRIHRRANVDANVLLDHRPDDERFFRPGSEKRDTEGEFATAAEPGSPYPASPSPARPGKQKRSGGR